MSKFDKHWGGEGSNRPALPWRPDLDVVESDLPASLLSEAFDYTQAQSDTYGYPKEGDVAAVAEAVVIGSYWCAFGNRIPAAHREADRLRKEKSPAAPALAKRPRGQPKKYGPHGFINTMALAFYCAGEKVGTAWDDYAPADAPSRFTRFCDGWLERLEVEIPSRKVYRDVIQRLKDAHQIE